jgi:hypothetical protein
MDVDQEEFSVDPSNNVDEGSLGPCSFPVFPHAILTYIPR